MDTGYNSTHLHVIRVRIRSDYGQSNTRKHVEQLQQGQRQVIDPVGLRRREEKCDR